ncbi:hypothetical protein FM036_44650 [Nostoc sp. HG1]|nr:hypothetical protein [Nostoc sp. HG1]
MKSQLVLVKNLPMSDQEAMYSLLENYFEGVTWNGFQSDLERKNWALLLKDESNVLKGFSTLLLCQRVFSGEQISVVYSGDTIVDLTARFSTMLPRTWIAAVNLLHQRHAESRLYWLLICSGFRTYRFLPTFWKEFYPRYDATTPHDHADLITHLAREYYGDYYQEATGIVRFKHPQVLRNGLIEIPTGRQTNPDIQFFEAKNPGYRQGDELVCLTEIGSHNLTRSGQRMWQAGSPLEFGQESGLI